VCGNCRIGRGSFIGASSCVAHNLSVAEDCVIAAGAIIQKDTSSHQVYLGNPARPTGYNSFDPYLSPQDQGFYENQQLSALIGRLNRANIFTYWSIRRRL
jgi:carbonic anhydrase/acetyltransferase-like protein (isoleucine patch superfamily)